MNIKIKLSILALALLLVIGTVFFWIKNHSFIELTVLGDTSEVLTYTFDKINTDDEIVVTTSEKSVRKLVPNGSYNVFVQSEESSYIVALETKPFLSTVKNSVVLKLEDNREFVGHNPGPCNTMLSDVLYSFECSGNLDSVIKHNPATASQPSYTLRTISENFTPILGVSQTKIGPVLFTEAVFKNEEEMESNYAISLLGGDFVLKDRREITDLYFDGDGYKITAYRDGLLVYRSDLTQGFYYATLGAAAEIIELPKPKKTGHRPVGLRSQNDSLVLIYSNSTIGDEVSDEKNPESELIIMTPSSTKRYEFKEFINDAALCGKKICVLSNFTVKSFIEKDKSLALESTIEKVDSLEIAADKVFLRTNKGIVDFDFDTNKGSFSYRFGGYTYCGINEVDLGYVICLIDADNNKVALRITSGFPLVQPIDKQVFKLQQQREVTDVSAYKNILFVTPYINLNQSTGDTQQNNLTEQQINEGKQNLSKGLNNSGLAGSSFTVINTTSPF